MCLKMLSAKWQQFFSGLNVLNVSFTTLTLEVEYCKVGVDLPGHRHSVVTLGVVTWVILRGDGDQVVIPATQWYMIVIFEMLGFFCQKVQTCFSHFYASSTSLQCKCFKSKQKQFLKVQYSFIQLNIFTQWWYLWPSEILMWSQKSQYYDCW